MTEYKNNWSEHVSGNRYAAALPEVSLIPVPAVAKAVTALNEARAFLADARRGLQANTVAIETAEAAVKSAAKAAGLKKKALPQGIRKPLIDAREAHELALLEDVARSESFVHAFYDLRAVLEANRKAMTDAALNDAQRALEGMAAARLAYESAQRRGLAAFGLLGMYGDADKNGGLRPIYREGTPVKGVFPSMRSGMALEALKEAIGATSITLNWYKSGGATDVEE